MKHTTNRWIGWMILFLYLFTAGCNPSPPVTETPAAGLRSTSTPHRVVPTGTPSPAPTVTVTQRPEADISQKCISIEPVLKTGDFSGWIIFNTNELRNNIDIKRNEIGLYHLDDGLIRVVGKFGGDVEISPDKKRFVYQNYETGAFELLLSDGGRIKSIQGEKIWYDVSGWMDNQKLFFLTGGINDTLRDNLYPRPITVYDPFTKERQILTTDYPNIDKSMGVNLDWNRWGITAYDRTLTRVVYLSSLDIDGKSGRGYVLYDIPGKKALAQFLVGAFNYPPLWYSDGSKFIAFVDTEFVMVTRDGEIKKVSNMNPGFTSFEAGKPKYGADLDTSWSPDGRYLAFWLVDLESMETWDDRKPTLAILDVETGKIVDTCLLSGDDIRYLTDYVYPIWSPDGKSIAVPVNFDAERSSNEVVLIDLENWEAYKIMENQYPAGWMINP